MRFGRHIETVVEISRSTRSLPMALLATTLCELMKGIVVGMLWMQNVHLGVPPGELVKKINPEYRAMFFNSKGGPQKIKSPPFLLSACSRTIPAYKLRLGALARSGSSVITCCIAVDSRFVATAKTISSHSRFPLLDLAIWFHENEGTFEAMFYMIPDSSYKQMFIEFLKWMLRWLPEERASIDELRGDP
ncbi:uncharacterized protein BT62DRAFT_1013302 [Guyanagaster necrorhizus]|uniref:Uncharacterized protein n=1 Tax=Guyanagaster necrorhizus TaxID=856835 RepID=A0A9P7VGG8_9AGAR|nr:uncharacterized protein BT62DRAFT_1014432 [Guyanagaster necrorhizus MCA 3950]XP_043032590.1 uncharacterized protein BT62DRAFT_1014396 [Guyanagaster necrorhizus MCA 3950]XP_043033450.1 uncharacterized protein BT62DRAFT_1013302 [Guyanagaster necrorhizus MCA 3950]KAG7439072.1 hypothetical protein BT62DRAFT_1014432 [Guyanagaster necrorhizus MCA 3950]KAG7439086.1 hypothetical protein BT62DRAFT_1014396 [Guyanagaster necrorhizus MCA 3950]KAG7439950.1 hypothetical protein BT62DRAFT_1013302 [Guyanag